MDDIPVMNADVDSNGEEFNEAHSELVRFLTQSQEMRTTARGALKQSLWAAGGTFAGAILGGPIGGLVGGITGSVLGLLKSDNYDGALLHIVQLEGHRRKVRDMYIYILNR
jgi:outer membrane lipoprotein SlyB